MNLIRANTRAGDCASCVTCGQTFAADSWVKWDRDYGLWHIECRAPEGARRRYPIGRTILKVCLIPIPLGLVIGGLPGGIIIGVGLAYLGAAIRREARRRAGYDEP
jgi:hypothetical protein